MKDRNMASHPLEAHIERICNVINQTRFRLRWTTTRMASYDP